MFDRHGLLALLAGRFLAFVRTLLPTMAGISGLSNLVEYYVAGRLDSEHWP
jgi:membrane protein DedA with SNARE-associated domain